MRVMSYSHNSGEEFPSETWLRTLPHGLNHTVRVRLLITLVVVVGAALYIKGWALGAATPIPSSSSPEAFAAFGYVFWTEPPSICIDAAIVCIHGFKKGFPILHPPFNIM